MYNTSIMKFLFSDNLRGTGKTAKLLTNCFPSVMKVTPLKKYVSTEMATI